MSVRVRFAPSPTGYLHVGGLRTALYNYLFAKHHGGSFILRIEDTDRSRFVDDAEEDILESLWWAGLSFDEGPGRDGAHAPYRQSERRDLYSEAAARLVSQGHAYYAFDTPEELEMMKSRLAAEGNPSPRYDAVTRRTMRNSLALSAAEVDALLSKDVPRVIRLKVPDAGLVTFSDSVRGEVTIDTAEIDDQVLIKSDGLPTYHLANVVDDHEMEVTHVIRGEEWLPSTPKHILLYRFLGWAPPEMAHLPLILSPTGGNLSKRTSGSQGIPVLVRDYVAAGYEPEALVNYLAFLGWNPGTEREVYTLDELVAEFSIARVRQSGVQFDPDKLRWFNEQHLRGLDQSELVRRVKVHTDRAGLAVSRDFLERVLMLMKDRISFAADIATGARYFIEDPESYDESGITKRWKEDSASLLTRYADLLESANEFDADSAEAMLRQLAEMSDVGAGRIIHPVRIALSGVTFGPGLFDLMEMLGRETCVRRIRAAVARIGR